MKSRRKPWTLRAARWAPLLAGGVALQFNLSGCDPQVKDAILGGVQTSLTGMVSSLTGVITSVINGVFLSFQNGDSTTQVTRAIVEATSSWLA
ncbi:MAG: hypothetical protein ACE5E1_03775 [Phycisphaerae bacterium]